MSTELGSTFEDPTETTPVDAIHQTTGSSMTSSSSSGAPLHFLCVVAVVGVVGVAVNGLVLYALVKSKQHKKLVLIFNQNVHDFVNCLLLAVAYSVKASHVYLSGAGGYLLCAALLSDVGSWGSLFGSVINLAAISIERYLKIVHHT